MVSDFYTAYDQLDGPHQRRWAHVLREIHESRRQHEEDAGFAAWAGQVHALYVRAKQWATQVDTQPAARRARTRLGFEEEL